LINVPINSKDGKVLLTNEDQMKRWIEHFHEVLNQLYYLILNRNQICLRRHISTGHHCPGIY